MSLNTYDLSAFLYKTSESISLLAISICVYLFLRIILEYIKVFKKNKS